MNILIVGSGGRENALAWALAKSDKVSGVIVSPGNGGTAGGKVKTAAVGVEDIEGLVKLGQTEDVRLVVPGPEALLVAGITDAFAKVGIPSLGPNAQVAQLEGSKAFSKAFMARHGIPTAEFQTFTDFASAKAYVEASPFNVVIKASGLAAGKGVIIPKDKAEAIESLDDMLVKKVFGDAGEEVVVEELLEGDEISVLALSDGYTVLDLPGAQDHKRAFDGDKGPNTGGMGAYAPAPVYTKSVRDEIMRTVIRPTIDGLRKDGTPFVGCLFTGLMLTPRGPKVLEYNVRFGDPETQAVLPLVRSDLADVFFACVEHRLDFATLDIAPGFGVSVVAAAGGYPGSYRKGDVISVSELPQSSYVFDAGTKRLGDGSVVTAGGRVLSVAATGATLREAVDLAYKAMGQVHFEGISFRKDIAHRAFALQDKQEKEKEQLTYAGAGVDIDAGNALVQRIKPAVKATRRPGADAVIGGFGGAFDLAATKYSDPILVSGTDGVGTKLKLAIETGLHKGVGIDLVAMSVNDLVVQGAEPLFFLDYYATSHLDVDVAADVITSVAKGCEESGCALVGGETAEMPGMYAAGDYDLAGFAVGAVERSQILPKGVAKGDVLLGLRSAGLHSNGFSLVRKVIERAGADLAAPPPYASTNKTLAEDILTPTRIYVKSVLSALPHIKAMSHITGGGFIENVPRVLPDNLAARINAASYELPPVFAWLKSQGNIDPNELAKTFNCGIGMVLVVAPESVSAATAALEAAGESVVHLGDLVEGTGCTMLNLDSWK